MSPNISHFLLSQSVLWHGFELADGIMREKETGLAWPPENWVYFAQTGER